MQGDSRSLLQNAANSLQFIRGPTSKTLRILCELYFLLTAWKFTLPLPASKTIKLNQKGFFLIPLSWPPVFFADVSGILSVPPTMPYFFENHFYLFWCLVFFDTPLMIGDWNMCYMCGWQTSLSIPINQSVSQETNSFNAPLALIMHWIKHWIVSEWQDRLLVFSMLKSWDTWSQWPKDKDSYVLAWSPSLAGLACCTHSLQIAFVLLLCVVEQVMCHIVMHLDETRICMLVLH